MKKPKKLSETDWKVFKLIAIGKTAKEVQSELGMPEWKCSYCTERIFKFLGVTSRVEVAHYALQYELVQNIFCKIPAPTNNANGR